MKNEQGTTKDVVDYLGQRFGSEFGFEPAERLYIDAY